LILKLDLSGNDLNDAWLASLAIAHAATLVSADEGFRRFPGLKWINPLSPRTKGHPKHRDRKAG